jgi:cellulose synthase/poly-beta-1,6-N-acetylglucosamine synthase-like glycosyltransferase
MKAVFFPLLLGGGHFLYLFLSMMCGGKTRPSPSPPSFFSVEHIVCFRNESAFVRRKLQNCSEIQYPHIHHTFIDDQSEDDTGSLLESFRATGVRVIHNDRNIGKNASQIRAASQTQADLLLFTDANVFLAPDALSHVVSSFTPDTGGVTGNVTMTRTIDRVVRDAMGKYWELEKRVKKFQSHWGAVIGFDGGFYCVRRNHFSLAEGFELGDLDTALNLLSRGLRVRFSEKARAMELEHREIRASFSARIRTANRTLWSLFRNRSFVRQAPFSVSVHLICHKWLRYGFLISVPPSLPFFLFDLAGRSLFCLLIAGGAMAIPPVFRFLMECLAVFTGGALALCGKEYRTWSTPKS